MSSKAHNIYIHESNESGNIDIWQNNYLINSNRVAKYVHLVNQNIVTMIFVIT